MPVAELMENEEIRGLIIGEPNFAGIVGLSNTAFTLRVSFTTLPLKQWTVRFALDSQVKKHFDLAGVRRAGTDLSGAACSGRDPG
ncbi:membrane protein YbiO [Escherichia coli]|uniref:Membrane protein YbiO n=1 Tax=Escherichia coli TaxID=562 RepID=A0A376MTZ0_ECOLX|nr:membrane protein YbiO [Escherichia coli]